MEPSYHRQDKPTLAFFHSFEYKELHQNTEGGNR